MSLNASLRDALFSYYSQQLGRVSTVEDLEREFFILSLGDGIYSRTWADAARAYYASWNGSNPAGSLNDEAFKYYSALSGLTPVERFTLTDHMEAVFGFGGGHNLTPPVTDNLELYLDGSAPDGYKFDGRVSKNLLTYNQATVEEGTTGLVSRTPNTTVARVTSQFFQGIASVSGTLTVAGPAALGIGGPVGTSGIPVRPNVTYTSHVAIKTTNADVVSASAQIYWYDSAGIFISATVGSSSVVNNSSWTKLTATGVSPSNAAYARFVGETNSTVVMANVIYFDAFGLWEGTSTDWVAPGKLHNINLLTWNQATIEEDTTGLYARGGTPTIARSTAQAASGSASLAATMTANGASAVGTNTVSGASGQTGGRVTPGRTYTAVAKVRMAAGSRNAQMYLVWNDSAGTQITAVGGSVVAFSSSGWALITATGVAPANAVYGGAAPQINDGVIADVMYFDEFGLWEGNSTVWVPPFRGLSGDSAIQDGSPVSFWRDLSGKERHAIQNTAANQPLFRKSDLVASKNLLSYNQATVETDLTGLGALSNCTVARSTAQFFSGTASMAATVTVATTPGWGTSSGINGVPVTPGKTYTASGKILITAGTGRVVSLRIHWFTSSGSSSSTPFSLPTVAPTLTPGQWETAFVTAVAPSDAAFAQVRYVISSGSVISDIFYTDEIGIWEGTSTNWVAPGLPPRNLLTYNQATVETDTAGFAPYSNCSIARSTAQALGGSASLSLTSTAGGAMTAGATSGVWADVVAGRTYTFVVWSRAATVTQQVRPDISWRDSGGGVLTSSSGTAVTNSTSGWTRHTLTVTAPANAARALVSVAVLNTAGAAEVHYFDNWMITEGPSTEWVTPVTLSATKPVIQFDESDKVLQSILNNNNQSQPFTIYFVGRRDAHVSGNRYWLGTNGAIRLGFSSDGLNYLQFAGTSVYGGAGVFAPGNTGVVTSKFKGSTGDAWLNGSIIINNLASGSNPLGSNLFVGSYTSGVTASITGWISTLLIYSGDHDTATRQRIERWLGARFGVTVA